MDQILRKYPVPVAGLVLGLASAGNLIQSYGEILRSLFGITSAVFYVLLIIKIIKFPDNFKENLDNPAVASVFPAFFMATMLLSVYLKPIIADLAFYMWIAGVILHLIYILWFSLKYTLKFNIKQIMPSWFIVYVGIAVAGVTAPAFKMNIIGQISFWFGLISYVILLPVVIYRVVIIKEMPEPIKPTLIIFAAPSSLLLAAYMNSFETKSLFIIYSLLTISLVMYAAAIIMLTKLIKLKFYPSFSGFTFPLIISGIAMKLTNGYLLKTDAPVSWLIYLVKFQEIIAVAITIYVLFKYMQFLFGRTKATV
ncbi:TDT family transporter [Sedimentibacter sp.]|uniref:TDT family transporter n=1 Tax=Sedimentibacter sp. TaxID=1960295 RepID=UPI0028AFA679|nr:TDT family transporter [Sedimentibacter sp.]